MIGRYRGVTSGKVIGCFLNHPLFILCQSFIACKGFLLPKADGGSCWLQRTTWRFSVGGDLVYAVDPEPDPTEPPPPSPPTRGGARRHCDRALRGTLPLVGRGGVGGSGARKAPAVAGRGLIP